MVSLVIDSDDYFYDSHFGEGLCRVELTAIWCSTRGLLAKGKADLGKLVVRGRSLVP